MVAAAGAAHDGEQNAGHPRLSRRGAGAADLHRRRHLVAATVLIDLKQRKPELAALKAGAAAAALLRRPEAALRDLIVHIDAVPDELDILGVDLVGHGERLLQRLRETVVKAAGGRTFTLGLICSFVVEHCFNNVRMAVFDETDRLVARREYGGEHIDAAPVGIAVDGDALVAHPGLGLRHILQRAVAKHLQTKRGIPADRAHRRGDGVAARSLGAGNADSHTVLIDAGAHRHTYGGDIIPSRKFRAGACHRKRDRSGLRTPQRRFYLAAKKFF